MSKVSRFTLTTLALALAGVALTALATEPTTRAPDISLSSPAIRTLQGRMQTRFDAYLRLPFELGALGFTKDGLVEVRDASKIPLAQRVDVNKQVADDNRDRRAVYREVAVANGHPEWESQIRSTFARQWVESAHGNWWYQDETGVWRQK